MNAKQPALIEDILKRSPVLPVVTIADAATAPDVARALVRGGIRSIEVTLRTPAALDFATAAACLKHSIPGDFNLASVADVQSVLSDTGFAVKR